MHPLRGFLLRLLIGKTPVIANVGLIINDKRTAEHDSITYINASRRYI